MGNIKIDDFEMTPFLSNFYESPIEFDGITYPTNEHFFQAMKTFHVAERKLIAAAATPGAAKRLGRQTQLRPDWEDIKEDVMLLGLRIKFSDPLLKAKLIATGDAELIEGNHWHDNTWGDCHCDKCKKIEGKNILGKLLMKVREECKPTGPRPMKWHIFDSGREPLCWDEFAIEFDTKETAERFIYSYIDGMGFDREQYFHDYGVSIEECIFYYDGGHVNLTNKIVGFNEGDCEGHLEDVK
jgi:ribA/ribD-fused uncharacterized protein